MGVYAKDPFLDYAKGAAKDVYLYAEGPHLVPQIIVFGEVG